MKSTFYYSRMCAAAKLENYDLFFDFFKEVLNEGGWYSELVLRQSPSLKPLQGMPKFEKLFKISVARANEDSKNNYNISTFPKNRAPPYPLILSLHADGGLVNEEFDALKGIVDQGYALGIPRSTSLLWSGKNGASWYDYELASNQIKAYLDSLNSDNSLDLGQITLCGLSSGAQLAIRLALTGTIPAQGFVVVAPGGELINDPEKWRPLIVDAQNRDLRGIIILGMEDKAVPREGIQKLVQMLNDGGIPCEFIEYPGLDHWYPPNIENVLGSFMRLA